MDALFHPAADFIARHAAWAGVMLGVVTLLESLVFLGAFVPATALMVMAGGLIAAGDLAPAPVILWCVGGAIIGDALSYEFGRRLGPSTLRRRLSGLIDARSPGPGYSSASTGRPRSSSVGSSGRFGPSCRLERDC